MVEKKRQMKKAFEELISTLDMGKQRLYKLEGESVETSQTEMQREIHTHTCTPKGNI